MKKYDVLVFSGPREPLELVAPFAGLYPLVGVHESDSGVAVYFEEGIVNDDFVNELLDMIPGGTELSVQREEVADQNWNAEFERSLSPVRVSEQLVITQSWNPVTPSTSDELVVVIDPKMSFGTAHHESTRLIARLLMKLDLTGRRVLDIGTGTGVLAIIAALRGAARVVAVDNNEWAVENARENFERNGVSSRIERRQGELREIDERDFDVILANLHRNLIVELLPEIANRLSGIEGLLLTSGVLIEDYELLLEAIERNEFSKIDEAFENEWVATAFAHRTT